MHYPIMWRFRLLRQIRGRGSSQNRRLLAAWGRAEGGTARYNPLNTTQPWPGATQYNADGVKNYRSGADGIRATAATLLNGRYPGLVADLRTGTLRAEDIVSRRRQELALWGTNPETILAVLRG